MSRKQVALKHTETEALDTVIREVCAFRTYVNDLLEEAEQQLQQRQSGKPWTKSHICAKYDSLLYRVSALNQTVALLRK